MALSASGPNKVQNGVDKESKSTIFSTILTLFDSVLDFLGPEAERAKELIFRLYSQLWARRAQMTPVAGPGNPKTCNEDAHLPENRSAGVPAENARN